MGFEMESEAWRREAEQKAQKAQKRPGSKEVKVPHRGPAKTVSDTRQLSEKVLRFRMEK